MVVVAVTALVLTPQSSWARSSSTHEFLMSCTYGVLAGSMVGAASLAFTDRPGDHLQRVARGASIGLYTGILLGLYVIYLVPDQQPRRQFMDEDFMMGQLAKKGPTLLPIIDFEQSLAGASLSWSF